MFEAITPSLIFQVVIGIAVTIGICALALKFLNITIEQVVNFFVATLCLSGAIALGAGDLLLNLFSVEETRQAKELNIYRCFAVGCTLASAGLGCVYWMTRNLGSLIGSISMMLIGGLFSLTAASTGFALNDKAFDDSQAEIDSLKAENALLLSENRQLGQSSALAKSAIENHQKNIDGCSKINSFKTCSDNYASIDKAVASSSENAEKIKSNNAQIAANNKKIVALQKNRKTKLSDSITDKTGVSGNIIQRIMTFALSFGVPIAINTLMIGFMSSVYPNGTGNVPKRRKKGFFGKLRQKFRRKKGRRPVKDVELTNSEFEKIKAAYDHLVSSERKPTIENVKSHLQSEHGKAMQRAKMSYGLNILKGAA